MGERLLITSAGIGGSNNLVRSLRAGDPSLEIFGCHDDRFFLKKAATDRAYLIPPLDTPAGARVLRRLVRTEAINLVIATSDADVAALSGLRSGLGRRLFLPRASVIDVCQDKYRLNAFLRARGVPAPATRPVTTLRHVARAFRQVAVDGGVWCRIRSGSGSLGAIAVTNPAQAREWIRYWQEMRNTAPSRFILSEYLPGRDLGCQSLWKDGALLVIKTYERLSYLATGSQPTEVSSVAGLAKTVVHPRVVEICTAAIRALDPRASGVFSIDLRENARGVPCITEINAGRFTSATPIFDLSGKYNMAVTYVRLAVGTPVEVRDAYDVAPDHYMLRDLDTPPSIFHADDFFEGIQEVASITNRGTKGRRHGQLSSHGEEKRHPAPSFHGAPFLEPGRAGAGAPAESGARGAQAEVRAPRQGREEARRQAHAAAGHEGPPGAPIAVTVPRGLDARAAEAFWLEARRLAQRYGADIIERAGDAGVSRARARPARTASPSRGRV